MFNYCTEHVKREIHVMEAEYLEGRTEKNK